MANLNRAAISGGSANMHKRAQINRCVICRDEIPWSRMYCRYCYRGRILPGDCLTCGRRLPASYRSNSWYCGKHCQTYKAPAVYRYVCPDGRSYVGSTHNHELRLRAGIKPSNPRLASALKKYPAQTWTFELLQLLPPGCAVPALRVCPKTSGGITKFSEHEAD